LAVYWVVELVVEMVDKLDRKWAVLTEAEKVVR
jgi:hypothetical protein